MRNVRIYKDDIREHVLRSLFFTDTVIALGDVVGKGPSAALNTAVIASVWTQHKHTWEKTDAIDIAGFVRDLNFNIHNLFKGKQFTTMQVVIFSAEAMEVYNFGAPPWLCINRERKIRAVRLPTSNPIGLVAEPPHAPKAPVALAAGEVLLGYSDGAIDGPGARRRLEASVQKEPSLDDFLLIDRLVREAGQVDRLPDDYTLLIVEPVVS